MTDSQSSPAPRDRADSQLNRRDRDTASDQITVPPPREHMHQDPREAHSPTQQSPADSSEAAPPAKRPRLSLLTLSGFLVFLATLVIWGALILLASIPEILRGSVRSSLNVSQTMLRLLTFIIIPALFAAVLGGTGISAIRQSEGRLRGLFIGCVSVIGFPVLAAILGIESLVEDAYPLAKSTSQTRWMLAGMAVVLCAAGLWLIHQASRFLRTS